MPATGPMRSAGSFTSTFELDGVPSQRARLGTCLASVGEGDIPCHGVFDMVDEVLRCLGASRGDGGEDLPGSCTAFALVAATDPAPPFDHGSLTRDEMITPLAVWTSH